uniref:Uncharacterized protein n=1 Tax=Romanomermis culicivorax TaxID=13658 RepID=A0A915HSF6_ROMCU
MVTFERSDNCQFLMGNSQVWLKVIIFHGIETFLNKKKTVKIINYLAGTGLGQSEAEPCRPARSAHPVRVIFKMKFTVTASHGIYKGDKLMKNIPFVESWTSLLKNIPPLRMFRLTEADTETVKTVIGNRNHDIQNWKIDAETRILEFLTAFASITGATKEKTWSLAPKTWRLLPRDCINDSTWWLNSSIGSETFVVLKSTELDSSSSKVGRSMWKSHKADDSVCNFSYLSVIRDIFDSRRWADVIHLTHMSKRPFSNYSCSFQEVKAKTDSDPSHGGLLSKSDEENEDILKEDIIRRSSMKNESL